jgi:predicted transcriptional regulator
MECFGHVRDYIRDVFYKASINKASKIYEHGISRAETANILGITQWELAGYAASSVIDIDLTLTKSIKERIKFTEEVFK